MDPTRALETKRREVLEEMAAFTRMRRGTINEQYFQVRQKDGSAVQRGPYFLYSRTEKGKSFSVRVGPVEVEQYREETENCRRFKELSNRYVLVCEELAELGRDMQEKKRSKRSRRNKGR
jgi:hypothetical protein